MLRSPLAALPLVALPAAAGLLCPAWASAGTWVEVTPPLIRWAPAVAPAGFDSGALPIGGGAIRLRPQPHRPARPDTLLVGVAPRNWDNDVEADGLRLTIAVLASGRPMAPRRGELSVTLYGERFATPTRLKPAELGRWTLPVRGHDFCGPDAAAAYRLPFRAFDPARGGRVVPDAVLRVSLGVPGVGRLNTSAPVRMLEFDPVRDRRFQATGSRRFVGER